MPSTKPTAPGPRPLRSHTRESVLAAIRETAARGGAGRLRFEAFRHATQISSATVQRLFGTWNAAVAAAGLAPNTRSLRIADDDLLKALRDAWAEAKGRLPPYVFDKTGRYCLRPYKQRWKTWAGALDALLAWLGQHDPKFPYRAQIEGEAEAARRRLGGKRVPMANRHYGPVLGFRNFLHAPGCESGLILLFGALSHELGFVIERVGTEFPDCEAKRSVPGHAGALELVRIEFEHRSRSFHLHGHDPKGCDLIVCWEHDWPDCPLPVLELKSEVERLRAAAPNGWRPPPHPALSSPIGGGEGT